MRGGYGLALALLTTAGVTRAEVLAETKTVEDYSLSWVRSEGADACPGRTDLAKEVATRLGHMPFVESAERAIEIRVEKTNTGFASHILVRDASGVVTGRRALASDDADCQVLFSATALAVALLIDPEVALRQPDAVARFDAATDPVPAPAASEPPPEPPRAAAASEPPPAPPPSQEPSSERAERLVTISAEGVLALGVVPEAAPGARLSAAARFGERWGYSLSAVALREGETSGQGATFEVGLTAFGLAATFDLVPGPGLRLGAEVGPWVGALHTAVYDPNPREAGDFWVAGLSAGLAAQVPLSTEVFLSVRGAALAPLVRRGLFVRGQSEPVWRQPPVAALASVGLGMSFF
jgi:hypothetical protein